MKQLYNQCKRLMLFALAFLSFEYASAQIEVSGQVTDADTEKPIAYADVVEQGTSNGTYTDVDGNFTLTVAGEESVLEFTFLGYKKKTVTVGNQTNFNVSMQTSAIQTEAVVKIGLASARSEDITGAITQLRGEDVTERPVLSVDQALSGKAAGVQVRSNSGSPGGGMDIVIRGRGTTGDARPLYVVDGVAQGYEYSGDPTNIEDISILKDASSTAIYGSRGANGVVLITTKGGNEAAKEAFATVSFDGYKGVQSTWKRIDVLSGEEFIEVHDLEVPEDYEVANTNWQDEVFRDAVIEKYKLRVDGGSTSGSWSTSVGYTNQEGIVKGTDYDRYDFGYKLMHQFSDKLSFGSTAGFNISKRNSIYEGTLEQSALGTALLADPTIPVYNEDGSWATPYFNSYYHPVGVIEANNANTPNLTRDGYGIGADAWVNYSIIDGLDFKTQFNFGKWENKDHFFIKEYAILGTQAQEESYMEKINQFGDNWGVTNTLTYTKKIYADEDSSQIKHSFRAMAGHEALSEKQETDRFTQNEFIGEDEFLQYMIAGSGDGEVDIRNYEAPSEHAMVSYIGRVEYGYGDKYLTNFTLRRDASSRFGDNNKVGLFPAVGLAWAVNKESFFYGNEWLHDNVYMFKIRGGWGKVGNENIGNYLYASSMGIGSASSYSFGKNKVSGIVPQSAGNPDLHWEEATSFNIGTDISLWQNMLIFNFDYFIKNNVDNLIAISVPDVVGIDGSDNNPMVNTAEVSNKGYEVSLSYMNKFKSESMNHVLDYNVSLNFTQIENEVTYLPGSDLLGGKFDRNEVFVSRTTEGYPIASFYGYKTDGIYQNWEEVNDGVQPDATPGDYKLVDISGDGQITGDDQTIIGNPHPKFTYGFSANASYAGFDLGVFFQGVQGNDIYNMTKYYLDGGYGVSNMSTRIYDVWSPENTGSDMPADNEWFRDKNYPHDGFIEDGSYLRLKNLTIGYTVPEKLSKKLKLQKLRVYTVIQNPITFTDYSGFDPEIGTNVETNWEGPEFGIDRGVYPQAKSIVFGLNLEF
ncbi:MAG: TonB-dependent receptor [Bacteroidales bacterium]